ncbi:MAG: hypothetical protein WCA31_03555 [Acidimicrobiales bacterium]
MIAVLLPSATSLATSPAELIVLITTIILMSVRAWTGITHAGLTQRASHVLTGATSVLIVIFFLLVIFRFKTLG